MVCSLWLLPGLDTGRRVSGGLVACTAGTPPSRLGDPRASGGLGGGFLLPAVGDEDDPVYSVVFGNTYDVLEGVLVPAVWLAALRCAPGG